MTNRNFKSKGQSILGKPKSMSELMADEEPKKLSDTITQNPNTTITQEKEELERLHCQIRADLMRKIDTVIYESKMSPEVKNLTKRTIIEEALEEYFKKRS